MYCTLMLRDQSVLEIRIENGFFISIDKIYNDSLLPLHLINNLDVSQLVKWLFSRLMPKSRPFYKHINKQFKALTETDIVNLALFENHGLSLSDQYWLRCEDEQLEWKDINFFANDFSYDVGNYFFNMDNTLEKDKFNLRSPDFMTNGIALKSWRMKEEKRLLFKAGQEQKRQEPINEAAISQFLQNCNFEYLRPAKYTLSRVRGTLCSVSENFLSDHVELVTAYSVANYKERPDGVLLYHHLREMCKELQIPNALPFMDAMLLFDNLIANKDRHLGNFGFLRDTKTMQFLGPAPLYDNGSSLWFDEILTHSGPGMADDIAKPFNRLHSDNLKDIKDVSLLKHINVKELNRLLMEGAQNSRFDMQQMRFICDNVKQRYEKICREIERNKDRGIER